MRNTFRILFYVNKQRVTEGRVPIYVRLSINGKSTFVSSRQRIPLLLWDSAANKAAGKSIEAKQINAGLERIRAKLLHHYQRISDKDAYVSAERVKSAYLGMGEEYETLLEALDKFNRDFKQHVGIDRAQSTYRKYDNVRKRLAEFLCDKLHREDIPLKELTETFITDYDLYLRSEKGLTPSCVCIYTKPLKMIVTKAHNAGLILRNPFSDYHPKKVTKERGYLIESELLQLMNHKFTFGGYGKVRDMFVFSCFTGMAHVDVKGLTKDMLQKSFDGELWIVKKRQKTNVLFKVKLCSITKRIIDNYKREVAGSNLVLPVPDIAYCNRVLKKIAAEVGIDKVISFHLARHRLATENIKPEDVKSVEVMENHQSIRALQNLEYSQQAGLNIKLKEEAKHRWVGVANTGVGVSPFLYDTSLFTMRIAGKWQSMESIRANNTGWNPASQNLRHYEDKIFGNDYKETLWPDYISVDNQSAPLNERRTRDNQSYLVNTTNTWRIGDVYDLKANMTYSSDRLNIANSAFTNYLDSEIASFLQEEYIRSQQHNLSIQLAVQANQPNYYLKDNLTVDVLWNNVGADVLGSRTLSQHAKSPPLKIANDLQLIKRLNNRILSLSSRNMFRYNPQSLSTSDGETHVVQDINSREFRSTTDLRYGWMTRRWQIYIRGGVDYGLRDLENNLVGLTLPYSTHADSRYHIFRTYLCPETTYQSKKLLLSLTLPIFYHLYCISDKGSNSQLWKNRVFTSPILFMHHSISAKTELSAQIRYALTPPALGLMNESVIMNDFRNLQLGTATFRGNTERSATVSVRYRNPISSLFANVSVKYEWNNYDLMSNQLFFKEYILNAYSRMSSDGKLLQVTGGISKGIRSGKMTFSVDAGYAQLHASSMRQDAVIPYIIRKYSVIPKIKGTLFKWWTLDYMMMYSYNSLNLKNADASSSDMLRQHLIFTFIPNSKVQVYIGAEHYFTQLNGVASNLLLADAGAKWIISNKVELSVSATNLLNDREYKYADIGSLSETYYAYRIRPRSIVLSAQIRF